MKKFGFTLTEVIISLGVIGVIVATTIPTVITNYQNRLNVTALHKVYNDIDSSITKYMTDQRVEDLRETPIRANLALFAGGYFEISTNCEKNMYSTSGCFAQTYGKLDGTEINKASSQCDFVFTTKSGYAVCLNAGNSASEVLKIEVDVNGLQKPNILGRDYFDDIKVNNDGKLYSNSGYFHNILDANWKMNY